MPSRSSSFQRLWKYSLALIVIIMMQLGLGIADIIIKCPICKETSYIPAACFALPVWTPVLFIGTSALGLMTGPESFNRNKLLRWCLVLSFISIAVCLVVIGWCVTNIVQSVSTGLLAAIGMESIALAALIIIITLVEVCLFIAFSLNCIDLIERRKGDSENSSSLSEGPADNKATRKKSKQKQWIFANNATLLNLPKARPAEENNPNNQNNALSGNQDNQSGLRSKRPTVMELMRTHFHTNKSVLLPSPTESESPKDSEDHTKSQRPKESQPPLKSQIAKESQSPPKSQRPKESQPPKPSSAINYERRLSGQYDNATPNNSRFENGSTGARNSFNAIKAFFDGNTPKLPGDSSSLPAKPKKTVADIHVISNNTLMGNSNTRFTHRDGASELNTVPNFTNMRLPPVHGNLQGHHHGRPGAKVENARHAKVTFMNSFERR